MKKIIFSFLITLSSLAAQSQVWNSVGAAPLSWWVDVVYADSARNALYIGGMFSTPFSHIAKWDGTTMSGLGTGMNGEVFSMAEYNGSLFAGGTFATAGGVIASGIAKWNGSAWSAVGTGMNSGSNVNALCVYNGELYAGGTFNTAGGVPVTGIAKWNGVSWSAVGTGTNGVLYTMTVFNNELYAGGTFTTAGGSPANYIAKWNGSTWSAVGTGMGSYVQALYVWNGNLYAGGRFTTAGGSPANYLAKWNGSAWSAVGTGFNNFVYAIGSYNGEMYAGGDFTIAGGVAASKIAKWNGSVWADVAGGMNGTVNTLTTYKGSIYAGGTMGFPVNYLGMLDNIPPYTERFQKIYKGTANNNETVYDIQQCVDWGYAITGHTNSYGPGGGDGYVIKTDTAGVISWAKSWGGNVFEQPHALSTISDGSIIFTGLTSSYGAGSNDLFAVSMDKNGATNWARAYGTTASEQGWGIKQTTGGGFVMAGTVGLDALVMRINSVGNITWTKKYATASTDLITSLELTSSGGYLIAGTTGTSPNTNMYVLNIDASGNLLWDRTIGGTNDENGYIAKQTNDGGFIIGGRTASFSTGLSYDAYLVKLNSAGNLVWSKTYATTQHEEIHDIKETSNGSFVLSGNSFYGSYYDLLLFKTSSDGSLISAKTYGASEMEFASGHMAKSTDGGFAMVGQSNSVPYSGGADYNIYLVKTDSLLNSGSCHQNNFTLTVSSPVSTVAAAGSATTNAGLAELAVSPVETNAPFTTYELTLAVAISNTNVSCYGGTNGQASAAPVGGISQYTYLWSNNATTTAISNLTAGAYSITITDSTLCSVTQTITITQPPVIGVSSAITNVTCSGGNNGAINITASGGTPPYTYLWNPGTYTTEDISNVMAATYSLTITDASACSKQQFITVAQPLPLIPTINKNETACGMPNSMNAAVSGGTLPYSFVWSTGSSNDSLYNQPGGTYSYTVTDANNCSSSVTANFAILVWQPVPICMVTVDSVASLYNTLVWEKPITAGIDSFFIYRNISSFMTKIGAVKYSSLSMFKDTTPGVLPKNQAHEYAISVKDTCGNESALSPSHITMHQLAPNYTSPPPRFDLSWSFYQGFSFSDYEVWRDTGNGGTWHKIGLVPYTLPTTYSDFTSPHDSSHYRIQVTPAQPCNATIIKHPDLNSATVKSSKSNGSDKIINPTSVAGSQADAGILIFPNPSTGIFTIKDLQHNLQTASVKVYNVLGEEIYQLPSQPVNQLTIDLRGNAKGVYHLQLLSGNTIINKKIVIE